VLVKKFLAILILFVAAVPSLSAQRVAIAPKIGTTGVGADLLFRLTDSVHLRGGYTTGSYEEELETNDVLYDGELELGGPSLLLNIHPRGRLFRFTIGAMADVIEAEARSTEDTVIIVNGTPYNVSDVGVLVGTADYDDVAPYVGLGWGNPFRNDRWSFYIDLGAAWVGNPDVELTANANDPSQQFPPGFEDDLAAEEEDIRTELDDYKIFPVLSFGLAFRF
jgi:hypothetical protein